MSRRWGEKLRLAGLYCINHLFLSFAFFQKQILQTRSSFQELLQQGRDRNGGKTDFYTRNHKSVCSSLIIIMSLRNVLLPLETFACAAFGDDRLPFSTVEICWLLWIQMNRTMFSSWSWLVSQSEVSETR